MKKQPSVTLILSALLFLSACSSVDLKSEKLSKIRIAVLPFIISGNRVSADLTAEFAGAMKRSTSFQITDPAQVESLVKSEKFRQLQSLPYRKRISEIGMMTGARYIIAGKISISKDLDISSQSRSILGIEKGPLAAYGIKLLLIDALTGKTISEARCLSNKKHKNLKRQIVPKSSLPRHIAEEFPDLTEELISGAWEVLQK